MVVAAFARENRTCKPSVSFIVLACPTRNHVRPVCSMRSVVRGGSWFIRFRRLDKYKRPWTHSSPPTFWVWDAETKRTTMPNFPVGR